MSIKKLAVKKIKKIKGGSKTQALHTCTPTEAGCINPVTGKTGPGQ